VSFLFALLSTSFSMSVVALALLFINKMVAPKVSATFRYNVWLLVLLGFIVPFRFNPLPALAPIHVPIAFASASATSNVPELMQDEAPQTSIIKPTAITPSEATPTSEEISALSVVSGDEKTLFPRTYILNGTWLAGVLAVLVYHLWSYLRFATSVKRFGRVIENGPLASLLKSVQEEMGLGGKPVALIACSFVSSPMLIGFFSPAILLPDSRISHEELDHAFRHELTHYRQMDTWRNLLTLIVTALHWFNPLVYLMAKVIRTDREVACDETVVTGYCVENRRDYGETIIGFIGITRARNPVLSTYFFGGSRSIKKRLVAIMDTNRKSKALATFSASFAILATMLSGGVIGIAPGVDRYSDTLPYIISPDDEFWKTTRLPAIQTIVPSTPHTGTEFRSFSFPSGGRLKISTIFGNIKLMAWEKDEVLLSAGFSPSSDGEHASIEVKGDSGSLELIVKVPPLPINRGNDNLHGAQCNLELKVPCNIVGNIEAVNGAIELHSISGTNRLEAINGTIALFEVSGNINASALNGGINGSVKDIEKSLDISLTNGDGNIRLLNPNGVFSVSSINGSVTMAIDPDVQKAQSKANMKFIAVNGSIVIR